MARPAGDARLIKVLRDDPGRTITARELMLRADIATLHALRTHIVAARHVLGDQAHQLQSVRGAGYRWADAATEQPRPGVPGELVLDLELRTATIDDVHASLTESQVAVLHALTTPPGRVLSAQQLHRHMNVASLAAVKIHVSELRKAVRRFGQVAIVTLRGQGYRYDGPPVRIRRSRITPTARTHVAGDGRVLVDGRPLRLREPEHALLALLLERTGQPVSRGELLACSGLRDIPSLQVAISNTRIALYNSPLNITYSPTPAGYTLTIG